MKARRTIDKQFQQRIRDEVEAEFQKQGNDTEFEEINDDELPF